MRNDKICKNMSFEECELTILRMAVDKAQKKIGKRNIINKNVNAIIKIVENFIKTKKLICYGGTAINNILPVESQFYDRDVDIPDYDFFSTNALEDAKELTDIYFQEGYVDVEAKSAQHFGTYKVYVNYIAVADITYLVEEIYRPLLKDSIIVDGIYYAAPNFLRMSMYHELSHPAGNTTRWEKVMKRLTLLNRYYPLKTNCHNVVFQRPMENKERQKEIYETIRNTFIGLGVVFFGSYAISLYSEYMPQRTRERLKQYADFDVLSNNPKMVASFVQERLVSIGIKNVKIIRHDNIGEIIPEHYQLTIGNDALCFIYKTIGCNSYNVIKYDNQMIRVASIDTMLSFYLAFLYTERPYYEPFIDRLLCMSQFLFRVQQQNRFEQKGLLRRFSILCAGHQESMEETRNEKANKYKELKNNPSKKKEYEQWFLNYHPGSQTKKNKKNKSKTIKNKKNKSKTIKNKK
jgi:hypothetical protein